jgi:hypothetical protein
MPPLDIIHIAHPFLILTRHLEHGRERLGGPCRGQETGLVVAKAVGRHAGLEGLKGGRGFRDLADLQHPCERRDVLADQVRGRSKEGGPAESPGGGETNVDGRVDGESWEGGGEGSRGAGSES